MNKIVAIVVTYNRVSILKQAIKCLLNQSVKDLDIIIIDNNSTDDTYKYANSINIDRVKYYNTGRNLGGAGGFNFGIRKAVECGYYFCWIMDDDTLAKPNALKNFLLADKKTNGNYGWLSSKTLWTNGKLCSMNIQRNSPYTDIKNFNTPLINAKMASFVSLFMNIEVIKKVGLPLKEFFIWTDDWEYTRRISKKYPCYVVNDSVVVHAMKKESIVNIAIDSEDRIERYKYFYRNDVYLYRREGVIGWIWLIGKFLWHSMQLILKNSNNKKIKFNIIWNGFKEGVKFNPKIEFVLDRKI